MKANSGWSAGQLATGLKVRGLKGLTREKWNDKISTMTKPPTEDDFIEFLEARIASKESESLAKYNSDSSCKGFNYSKKSKDKHMLRITQSNSGNSSLSCNICHRQHYTYKCPTLLSQTVEQRSETVKQKRLCFNCLGTDHTVYTCPSKKSCRECNRRHNSLLHRHTTSHITATAPTTSASGNDERSTRVMHKENRNNRLVHTALASIASDKMSYTRRILIDSGSEATLISRRFANTLKTTMHKHHTKLSVGGEFPLESDMVVDLTLSCPRQYSTREIAIQAYVVDKVCKDIQGQDTSRIRQMDFIQGKQLADPLMGEPVQVDLLLDIADSYRCYLTNMASSANGELKAFETIFGWIVGGGTPSSLHEEAVCRRVEKHEDTADEICERLWKIDQIPGEEEQLSSEDQKALDYFNTTTTREEDGRVMVKLPRKSPVPQLGESRSIAEQRFLQNERSLRRKGKLEEYEAQVQDYAERNHAEVPFEDLVKPNSDQFYLPMHGVEKATSTTTKLRVVSDASAKTSTGVSLNDTLITGPSLYPELTTVLNKFRLWDIAYSADISKMFREILLHPDERDFHRYLVRNSVGEIEDWRMKRLTFGVSSSPFLATASLRRIAQDHVKENFTDPLVEKNFYVDDFLHGSNSVEDAIAVHRDLTGLLAKGKMSLRKWRTNSQALRDAIPVELRESDPLQVGDSIDGCPKALGIHWPTSSDQLFVVTPSPLKTDHPTKRQVSSHHSKVFDVLGWFSPINVQPRKIMQELWKRKIGWDEKIPDDLLQAWEKWSSELPSITTHAIDRNFVKTQATVIEMQLHGFSDASKLAYGAVVYGRFRHKDTTITTALISAKVKIAPIKDLSIPRLELNGAELLSRLLKAVAKDLDIPLPQIFAWCDSTAVLGWIRKPPEKGSVYVKNRALKIQQNIPALHWRYVSTSTNPADIVSRGAFPQELLLNSLWWEGPSWLKFSPTEWPIKLDIGDLPIKEQQSENQIQRSVQVVRIQSHESEELYHFNSMMKIERVLAIGKKWKQRAQSKIKTSVRPDCQDLKSARIQLLCLAQEYHFQAEREALKKNKPIFANSKISHLNPFLDENGLIRLQGRLHNANISTNAKQPILLAKKSRIAHLLLIDLHRIYKHPPARTMMAILSNEYFISGVRSLARKIARDCVHCRQVNSIPCTQKLGQLPSQRVNFKSAFQEVGVDYAGPILVKSGSNKRKPALEKGYVAVFTCMVTRAVHLEPVTSLHADSFIAALERFVNRRGCPSTIYSDNGTNFVAAEKEIRFAINSITKQDVVRTFTRTKNISWKFSPVQSPHHGGLWEAGVKQMKRALAKIIGSQKLTFEELATALTHVEALLNCRPITTLDSLPDDGIPVLTPAHFLNGRPLLALPTTLPNSVLTRSVLKHWNHVKRLQIELQQRWYHEYLKIHQQQSKKWKKRSPNLQIGDIVGVRSVLLGNQRLPYAVVTNTFSRTR